MKDVRRYLLSGCTLVCIIVLSQGCAGKAKSNSEFIRTKAAEVNVAGVGAFKKGEYSKAREKFLEALRIDRSIGNRPSELLDLINIGRASTQMGDYPASASYLNEAIRLGVSIRDDKNLSEAYATLAQANYLSGDSGSAFDNIEESLGIDERLGYKSGAKLNLKALIYIDSGRRAEAGEVLKKALQINKDDNNLLETANSCRAMARLKRDENKTSEAMDLYRLAYDMDKTNGESKKIASDLEGMGELTLKEGRAKEAIALFERSYIVSLNSNMPSQAVSAIDRIIDTYRSLGDEDKAHFYMNIKNGIVTNAGIR